MISPIISSMISPIISSMISPIISPMIVATYPIYVLHSQPLFRTLSFKPEPLLLSLISPMIVAHLVKSGSDLKSRYPFNPIKSPITATMSICIGVVRHHSFISSERHYANVYATIINIAMLVTFCDPTINSTVLLEAIKLNRAQLN